MSRSRFAFVVVLLFVAVSVSLHTADASSAHVPAAAPALQATPAPTPTPLPSIPPQTAAPIGEGTQQVLLILGLAVLSVALIAGGIYLRKRWIATRY
jgi:hypothetical protein